VVYTRWVLRGVHRRYIPGGVYPGVYALYTLGGVYLPVCIPPYTTLGIPPPRYTAGHCTTLLGGYAGCTAAKPWAQERRNPWVEALVRVNVVKCVMVGVSLCAELLRLTEKNG